MPNENQNIEIHTYIHMVDPNSLGPGCVQISEKFG